MAFFQGLEIQGKGKCKKKEKSWSVVNKSNFSAFVAFEETEDDILSLKHISWLQKISETYFQLWNRTLFPSLQGALTMRGFIPTGYYSCGALLPFT